MHVRDIGGKMSLNVLLHRPVRHVAQAGGMMGYPFLRGGGGGGGGGREPVVGGLTFPLTPPGSGTGIGRTGGGLGCFCGTCSLRHVLQELDHFHLLSGNKDRVVRVQRDFLV